MGQKTFCPFINGNCVDKCMFFSVGGVLGDDRMTRHCMIAKALIEFPDSERQEAAMASVLTALKHL